jgi:hypothetical protein
MEAEKKQKMINEGLDPNTSTRMTIPTRRQGTDGNGQR